MIRQERINGMQKQVTSCIAQAYERGFKDGMEEHKRLEKEREVKLKELEKRVQKLDREFKGRQWTYPQNFTEPKEKIYCDRDYCYTYGSCDECPAYDYVGE